MKKKVAAAYEIIIGALELFAVALAVLDITQSLNAWQRMADNIILAIFVADYIVRLLVSDDKKDFVKKNIFDLIAIIPFSSFLELSGLRDLQG